MKLSALAVPLLFAISLKLLSVFQLSQYSDVLDHRYKSYGDTSKETVLLVPGLDGAVSFFGDIIPELTMQYHVVVFYLPLRARTMPEDLYTFEYIASELRKVLDELHLSQVNLVGESFGGVISQYFALAYPERLKKMVLLSSLAKMDLPPEVQWKLDYLLPVISTIGSYLPNFAQMFFAQVHVEDVVEPHESNYVRQLFIKEASFAHFFSVIARIRLASKLDITSRIPSIQNPTLVIYGSEDHFTKPDSLQIHGLLPNSELTSLPGGHLAHVTSPKAFAALVTSFVDGKDRNKEEGKE
mmetsp:Transcript_3388/g.5269  ORF Transcript_3388/g.5269 Transcript_3388/m.5269 type:complete len:298 (+) Transcript_3388:94-987(+)